MTSPNTEKAALSRRVTGRIAYRDTTGAETGREHFEVIDHDGGHILRALCEFDDIGLLRDVTLAMDAQWRPHDGFCRIIQYGKTAAATWFAVGDDAVEAIGQYDGIGRVDQRLATTPRLRYLGLHPLQGDALIAEVRGVADPGVFVTVDAITNSISPNGDEGALQAVPVTIDVAFVGYEDIMVTAGSFAARRYALRWRTDWPVADLWVRRDDSIFLRLAWTMTGHSFELTALMDGRAEG